MRLQEVINDYRQVVQNDSGGYIDSEGLDKFFFLDESWDIRRSITTIGAEAVDNLVDFIISTYCPTGGAWLDYEFESVPDAEEIQQATQAKKILVDRLCQSNFYNTMFATLKTGLLCSRAYMSCYYDEAISFAQHRDEDFYLSKDEVYGNRRLYTTKEMTGDDIRAIFVDLPNYFIDTMGQPKDPVCNAIFNVIEAIIPNNSRFFDKPTKKYGRNFRKVYFITGLQGAEPDVTLTSTIPEKDLYLRSLPIIDFVGARGNSFGSLALPALVQLEEYELQKSSYSKQITKPPTTLDVRTHERGTYDLSYEGLILVGPGETKPETFNTTGNLPYGIEEFRTKKEEIQRIFKWHLIEQSKITSLSQGEVAANSLRAIDAISPLVIDFLNKSLAYLIQRMDNLLMKKDDQYRKLRKNISAKTVVAGVGVMRKKLEKRVAAAQFAQVMVPYLQIDQEATMRINGDRVAKVLASCYDFSDALHTDNEVAEMQKAMIQQQQQQQQLEQEKLASEAQAGLEGQPV